MGHEVFISHAASNKVVADAMLKKLEDAGIQCWIAPRDIRPGATWGGAIVRAIEASKILIVIFSEKSNKSHQVLREVERAVQKDIVLLPFRIDDVMPSVDMEYFLSATHWLDALSGDLDAHLDNLVDTAAMILAQRKEEHAAPADAPENPSDQDLEPPTETETIRQPLPAAESDAIIVAAEDDVPPVVSDSAAVSKVPDARQDSRDNLAASVAANDVLDKNVNKLRIDPLLGSNSDPASRRFERTEPRLDLDAHPFPPGPVDSPDAGQEISLADSSNESAENDAGQRHAGAERSVSDGANPASLAIGEDEVSRPTHRGQSAKFPLLAMLALIPILAVIWFFLKPTDWFGEHEVSPPVSTEIAHLESRASVDMVTPQSPELTAPVATKLEVETLTADKQELALENAAPVEQSLAEQQAAALALQEAQEEAQRKAEELARAKLRAEALAALKSSAAAGDLNAQLELALKYELGDGVKKSSDQARSWYQQAAQQGSSAAQFKLGKILAQDGPAQNADSAINWLRAAAEQGHIEAQSHLGAIYENGKIVERDYLQSANWYQLAADQGSADAQRSLGVFYEFGLGVRQHSEEALKWYKLAADQGDAKANFYRQQLAQKLGQQ